MRFEVRKVKQKKCRGCGKTINGPALIKLYPRIIQFIFVILFRPVEFLCRKCAMKFLYHENREIQDAMRKLSGYDYVFLGIDEWGSRRLFVVLEDDVHIMSKRILERRLNDDELNQVKKGIESGLSFGMDIVLETAITEAVPEEDQKKIFERKD